MHNEIEHITLLLNYNFVHLESSSAFKMYGVDKLEMFAWFVKAAR